MQEVRPASGARLGRRQLQHQSPGGLHCASLSMCGGHEAVRPASQRGAAGLGHRPHRVPDSKLTLKFWVAVDVLHVLFACVAGHFGDISILSTSWPLVAVP